MYDSLLTSLRRQAHLQQSLHRRIEALRIVDSNKEPLHLKKGDNLVMLKVVDLSGQWGACARIFTELK